MERRIKIYAEDKPIYDIVQKHGFDFVVDEWKNLISKQTKVCIVSDTNVSSLYLENLKAELLGYVSEITEFVFPAGEEYKNLDTVQGLYRHLILSKFDRNDFLIALGGGVVGDLTGYAAATYLRGISFIQVPTTLLAMVDSSIGGKTGVDFDQFKNMVGAFHQPKSVYINLSVLLSLDDKQFFSGFGEIIKYGLIKDSKYYKLLMENKNQLKNRNLDLIEEIIYHSCLIKKNVVEQDPYEKADRALLNLGHTIGHAVEKLMDFKMLHGECVSIGIMASSYISMKRGYITQEQQKDIMQILHDFNLPTSIKGLDTQEILRITKNDKKMDAGTIKFILIKQIGKAIIDNTVTDEELTEAINYIIN